MLPDERMVLEDDERTALEDGVRVGVVARWVVVVVRVGVATR